jgi:hypothetical protein
MTVSSACRQIVEEDMAKVPEHHVGVPYADFVGELSQKRRFRRYFEIGVNEGRLMSYVHSDVAVGVDPNYVLSQNAAQHKKRTHLLNETSDHFFERPDLIACLGGPPDFSFLDGYHTFEYLLRDFMNTEAICSRASIIGMHDCLPLDDIMAERDFVLWQSRTIGTRYQGAWTGDVWKIVPILRKYRPDLRLLLVDSPPTGVVCATRLDPTSTVLRDNYLRIMDEFAPVPNTIGSITELYQKNNLVSSSAILNGMDHSLFFNT